MGCYVGIDIGAVSATAAVFFPQDGPPCRPPSGFAPLEEARTGGAVYLADYRRTRGRPLQAAADVLDSVVAWVGPEGIAGVAFTGGAGVLPAETFGAQAVNEFKAIAVGLSAADVDCRTVFEMGGETSKYLLLNRNDDGTYSIVDYATNGDCAAGTGSFIDQQAGRLKYKVEEIGGICLRADRSAQIAGRCSVFAKSDMIHAQQKGYNPAEVLKGLCDAVARNFRLAVVRSHTIEPPVAFIGGLTANQAVVQGVRETFDLAEEELVVPPAAPHLAAVGAAVCASRQESGPDLDVSGLGDLVSVEEDGARKFPTQAPLKMDDVVLLRDRVAPFPAPEEIAGRIEAFLGIDIGSVSTNLVVVDDNGRVVEEIYTRTQGRPIEVVREGLARIERRWGRKLNILGVGTTGSGRELIGQLVGADTVNDEITAHKTGSTFVGKTMLDGRQPDTIFEIGGQDSKYISLQDGVVVDFTMNEACAAGTGSFLEERAEELDIAIKGEFAELALSSAAPIRLGERCTVFMERDVNSYLHRGADKADLVAGLAYSVVYNYINRVVRGRHVGDCIFFQGGTAYNDAVAAAFAAVCGKEVIVPPHNGVIGAIGAALLAREKMLPASAGGADRPDAVEGRYVSETLPDTGAPASRFRGYDLSKVDYTLREFTCKGCSNACRIQEFTVEGEKTYWGDKCSDRFRKRTGSGRQAGIEDLMQHRLDLLLDESNLHAVPEGAPTVGIPMTMFAWEQLPFWRTLLARCGFATVLSDTTNAKIIQAGLQTVVAEPCFPIIVAHGHVANLIDKDVDHILLPNVVTLETQWNEVESQLCPWHQTLPFVIRRAPAFARQAGRFLSPTVRFAEGRDATRKALRTFFKGLGVDRKTVDEAVAAGYAAQDAFRGRILDAGAEALHALERTGEVGIVLVGRPYNIHDAGMNLSVAQKMRDLYGVNCVPLDFLPTDDVDVTEVNDNMYWTLGRSILAAAKLVGRHKNLHIIYITNFKCGPDSFIKHFVKRASGKPFLTLQFDGHSNDAGIMTRCEAYLDSKGVLRGRADEQDAVEQAAV